MAISDPYATERTSLASDKAVRPFLAPTFDPVDYLNAILPSWTPSRSQPSTSTSSTTSSLTDLNNQAQSLLAQLSAQLTRLSSTLSKLTDDILRCGGRLAYEVEVLRGDAGSLHEVLTEGLRADIERFVPGGLPASGTGNGRARARSRGVSLSVSTATANGAATNVNSILDQEDKAADARRKCGPEADLQQLRTLALVRDRLELVIKIFGAALEWSIPPSEVSVKSSFISVSGPDASGDDAAEREKKGKAFAEKVRDEVADLAGANGEGAHAALQRIEQFRELAEVWKGTSEEKARLRFVDSLTKLVEQKKTSRNRDENSILASGYRFRAESQSRNGPPSKR